jgi:hypothetical protein
MSVEAIKAIQLVYANTTKHDWPDDIWDAICKAIEAEKANERSEGEPVAMKRQLVKIHDALSAHLGDTDPYIPEDMTDDEVCEYEPVFWAAKEIAALIGDAPWSNYTHPYESQPKRYVATPREPLTDEQIWDAVQHGVIGSIGFPSKAIAVARAIEAAHGIK